MTDHNDDAQEIGYFDARDELHDLHRQYDASGGDMAIWDRLCARKLELLEMGGDAQAGAERYQEDIEEAASARGYW